MKGSVLRIVTLAVAVYATWLVLSGHFDSIFLLTIGAVCTAIVVYVAVRMDVVDAEGVPALSVTGRVFTYIPWLILEIVRSNLATTKVILNPSLPINPMVFRVRSLQRTDLGKFIFANSITLTPGTTTVGFRDDDLFVHALVADDATGMGEGEMNRRVAALERELVR